MRHARLRQRRGAAPIWAGVHIHAGRDNLLENNIFVEGKAQQMQYSGHDPKSEVIASHLKLFEKFQHNPAYAKYPEVAKIDPQTVWRMVGNKFLRNIIYYRNRDARLYQYSPIFSRTERIGLQPGLARRANALDRRKCGAVRGPNLIAIRASKTNPWASFQFRGDGASGPPSKPGRRESTSSPTRGSARCGASIPGRRRTASGGSTPLGSRFPRRSARAPLTVSRPGFAPSAKGLPRNWSLLLSDRNAHNWQAAHLLHCGPEWRQAELGIKLPAPGDPDYKPSMEGVLFPHRFRRRLGGFLAGRRVASRSGAAGFVAGVAGVGPGPAFAAGRSAFVDAGKDDYRLRADSPALKLGFKPIPWDKIGPYADPLRARWPIVEGRACGRIRYRRKRRRRLGSDCGGDELEINGVSRYSEHPHPRPLSRQGRGEKHRRPLRIAQGV